MINRDSILSIRRWHLKTQGILYTVSCTVILLFFSLLYLVFLSKSSVPLCSVFCLSEYFCCSTWVFSPWQLLNVIALKELNPLNFISPALPWRVTDDKHSEGKEHHEHYVSTPWLAENNTPFALLKMLFVNAKYRGPSHNRCNKLVYCLVSKLFSLWLLLLPFTP